MPAPVLDAPEQKYTYADLLAWDDGNRYELIDGRAYMMAGASNDHQEISAALTAAMFNHLKAKGCMVYPAPFDVNLAADMGLKSRNVVQPDLTITCQKDKTSKSGFAGAPEWVIEIESLSTAKKDLNEKHAKYMEYGVREYWFVKPAERAVLVFLFKEGVEEVMNIYSWPDEIPSVTQPGLVIRTEDIFPG